MTDRNKSLTAVVCGMPFSGTTYLSRIICSHPNIDSGFECGLLFENSPRDFHRRKKFYGWMMSNNVPYNWKLSQEDMNYICNTDNFYEAYDRIVDRCHLFNDNVNKIIDKTPAYIYRLRGIMTNVDRTPFIVIRKEPDFQFSSYKNRGKTIDEFAKLYRRQHNSISRVKRIPILSKRLLIVNFDDLHTDLNGSLEKLFDFISQFSNIEFDINRMKSLMEESIQSDIKSNVKKLRKKFDYQTAKKNFRDSFTSYESRILEQLTELE